MLNTYPLICMTITGIGFLSIIVISLFQIAQNYLFDDNSSRCLASRIISYFEDAFDDAPNIANTAFFLMCGLLAAFSSPIVLPLIVIYLILRSVRFVVRLSKLSKNILPYIHNHPKEVKKSDPPTFKDLKF